ncbi:MAG: ABC transporter permease [Deltaproteobacteria bacterium]|nr:ABC transporter permease [Deltaproteobacteria bacterium]MBW1992914.1 ABC transporter permease [Deltaproteobacteria bacterium]MBW2151466.1 ABC transporter permease [Deltaproteobacteria bacterium]
MLNLKGYGWMLWEGTRITILVGICSMIIAVVLGLIGAWGKLSRVKSARAIADTYTTIVRGIPELVLILLVYYGVPTLIQDIMKAAGMEILINLNPFAAGVFTIGFIYGAFSTEVFRGAYLAVPKGQIEAARSVGMSAPLAFRRVILPQMWRYALPALGNVWMILIKATALISVIQLPELMRNADIAARATRLPFTCYFAASLIYLGITVVSMLLQQRAEAWAARGIRRA